MIEPVPANLLRFFHEPNFVSRIEVSTHIEYDEVETLGGERRTFERGRRETFEMLILIDYDEHGQCCEAAAGMLSAFCQGWVSGHRTVEATVGSQPYRLTAVRGDRGTPMRRQGSLTVTGYAYQGDYASSDAARVAIASIPPPPVRIGPRNIVSLKQRGLEL